MKDATRLAPVSAGERIVTIDVLRGFALLGILIANMRFFAHPVSAAFQVTAAMPAWQAAAYWLEGLLVNGKFYPLFSLLFGLGFAVQLMRARERGRPIAGLYLRRLLILLGFGLIHGYLIWSGDILTAYALIGMLLLAFSRLSARGLGIAAVMVLGIQLGMVAMGGYHSYRVAENPQAHAAEIAAREKNHTREAALRRDAEQAYSQGSYTQALAVRAREFSNAVASLPFYGLQILGMFLLGAWVGRRGFLAAPGKHRKTLKRFAVWGWALGLPLATAYATWTLFIDYAAGVSGPMILSFGLNVLAGAAMVFGVVGSMALLMQSRAARVLGNLAAVGRMALSNYLLQSVVCTLVFYHYGLGMMGRLDFGAQALLVIGLYAVQVIVSGWWLRRFRFGPMEWLWRSMTYLRLQPMRQPTADAPTGDLSRS